MKKLTPILLLSFVNVIGFSLLIPVLPEVLKLLTGESSGILYGALLSSYAFSQFLAAPILGSMSDKYGRRPILLLSQFGTLMSWVIFGAAFFIPKDMSIGSISLPLLVIAFSRLTDGLTGGNISVAQAWVSDKTTPEEKTKAFGLIGATFGVGFLLGPALGGFSVSSSIHFLGTAIFAFLLSLVTLGFIYWKLPESLPKKDRCESAEKSLMDHLRIAKKFKLFRENAVIANLLEVRIVFSLAFVGFTTSLILLFGRTYHLSAIQIGLIMSVIGIFSILNQGWLVPKVTKKIGALKTFFVGLLLSAIALGLHSLLPLVFAPSFSGLVIPFFFMFAFPLNLGLSMTMTTFKTILTTNTAPSQQGQAMGLDEAISSFGQGVTPLFAGVLYDWIGFFAFAFYGGALLLVSAAAYARGLRKAKLK